MHENFVLSNSRLLSRLFNVNSTVLNRPIEIHQSMICKRCQRSLRSSDGLKCGICESCFHMRCTNESEKEQHDCGDNGYRWKCSLCKSLVNNLHSSDSESSKEKDDKNNNLLQAFSVIGEKFELVNKIQLPKLNSELCHIKCVADHIAQQNEDILKKINKMEESRNEEKHNSSNRYRKRHLSLMPKLVSENDKEVPVSITEKNMRYRTRRRSYLLHRIFRILNRKMNRSSRY